MHNIAFLENVISTKLNNLCFVKSDQKHILQNLCEQHFNCPFKNTLNKFYMLTIQCEYFQTLVYVKNVVLLYNILYIYILKHLFEINNIFPLYYSDTDRLGIQ